MDCSPTQKLNVPGLKARLPMFLLIRKHSKVAIYDDMVEITSPGKLPPSIDFNRMEDRESDIRTKVIAAVF